MRGIEVHIDRHSCRATACTPLQRVVQAVRIWNEDRLPAIEKDHCRLECRESAKRFFQAAQIRFAVAAVASIENIETEQYDIYGLVAVGKTALAKDSYIDLVHWILPVLVDRDVDINRQRALVLLDQSWKDITRKVHV